MSEYVYFFVRHGDTFLPLDAGFSRSSKIFQYFSDRVPFEKVRALTRGNLSDTGLLIREDIRNYEKKIDKFTHLIEKIKSMDGTLNEKIEATADYEEAIEEIRDEITGLNYADDFVCFLLNVIDGARWHGLDGIKEDEYLYVALENSSPAIDDIWAPPF